MERNDVHTPNLAALQGRRRDDQPITEEEFAAIGRAAHRELLKILETKRARHQKRRRTHPLMQDHRAES